MSDKSELPVPMPRLDSDIPLVFLGFCEKFGYQDGVGGASVNLRGLSSSASSVIFPTWLRGYRMVFAAFLTHSLNESPSLIRVHVRDDFDQTVCSFDLNITLANSNDNVAKNTQVQHASSNSRFLNGTWAMMEVVPDTTSGLFLNPGQYRLVRQLGNEEEAIGSFAMLWAIAPPLSAETILALKSDPKATKSIVMRLGCKECDAKFKVYVGLEKSVSHEQEGATWYKETPDIWTCTCGATQIPIHYLRESMHGLLIVNQSHNAKPETLSAVPYYESPVLVQIHREFRALIDSKSDEISYQRFIEENPILLHAFSPEKVFPEQSILGKFRADFIVHSTNGDLIMIEIEKPSTPLLKKKGGRHSHLQHAFDQVNDWTHVVREHRQAVLDCIDVCSESVNQIRGVVIAGNDTDQDVKNLRRLKSEDLGAVQFYTFDDLANMLQSTITSFSQL